MALKQKSVEKSLTAHVLQEVKKRSWWQCLLGLKCILCIKNNSQQFYSEHGCVLESVLCLWPRRKAHHLIEGCWKPEMEILQSHMGASSKYRSVWKGLVPRKLGVILGEDWVPHCQSIASCPYLLVRWRWGGFPQQTAEVTPATLDGGYFSTTPTTCSQPYAYFSYSTDVSTQTCSFPQLFPGRNMNFRWWNNPFQRGSGF